MTDNLLKSQAFKLKGRLFTFTVMQLLSCDLVLFEQELEELIVKAPKLFDNAPVVIDCADIDADQIDLQSICQSMRLHGLIPVAIQGGTAFLETVAQAQGLAVFHASHKHVVSKTDEPETQPTETIRTKLLTTPVRSGQQVVSKGGDLVVTAAVSHGAELLADGNIHVYGALRGRALAGIAGDVQARIFCQSLEAELIAIAGCYRLSDSFEPVAGPCQIYLQDDHLFIEPL